MKKQMLIQNKFFNNDALIIYNNLINNNLKFIEKIIKKYHRN